MIAAIPAELRPRVAHVIRLLGSDRDGEILAAVRGLRRTLAGAGLDLHDLAASMESASPDPQRSLAPCTPPSARHGWAWGNVGRAAVLDFLKRNKNTNVLSTWEDEFLNSIIGKIRDPGRNLSERQAETLNQILAKIAGAQP